MENLIDEISMGPFGSDIKVDNFVSKGVPVLNGSNINGIKLSEQFSNFVTKEKANSLKKANAKRGDIIVTHRGTLGQIAYIPENSSLERYIISQSQFRISLKRGLVDPIYFTYYFHTNEGQKRLLSFKSHVGVPALAQATTNFRKLEFPLIPLNSQKQIAKVLSDLDSKIELNNKINAELEAMAKLIYDYWFVQFDFPDGNGKPYKSSGGKMVYNEELKREIPEGWEAGNCSDLFDFNPSLSIKKGAISSHIDMNALPVSGFMTKQVKKKPFSGGMKFQNGDVVVARITPCLENGKTGLITLLDENEIGFGSTEFIVLRGKNFDLRCFGSCLVRSEKFRKYAISKMTGTSGRKRVNYPALESYKLPVFNEVLLRAFEEKSSPFFKKMTSNTNENQKLVELRDWLLPMLMNGQVTVSDTQQ